MNGEKDVHRTLTTAYSHAGTFPPRRATPGKLSKPLLLHAGSGCSCLLPAGKGLWPALLPRPWAGDHDTRCLPPRQRGWPSWGCNQQDPCGASERLATACLSWLGSCGAAPIDSFPYILDSDRLSVGWADLPQNRKLALYARKKKS